ncbi:MAG: hypothetical protein ABSF91_01380 [Bacteroidota bacterium]
MPRRGIAVRIASFMWHFGKSLLEQLLLSRGEEPTGKVVFFVATKNQRDALSPIANRTGEQVFYGVGNYGERRFPLASAYAASLFFLPLVLSRFIGSRGYQRKSFEIAFDMYWLSYGFYIASRKLFRKIRPACLVVSNDHSTLNRTIAKAAMDECVQTIYIQHASVAEGKFPLLSFDYAFLDGRDALTKYDLLGESKTKVFLTGIAKFDAYSTAINSANSVKSLGVCVNTLDPVSRVEELCRHLKQHISSLDIIIRPHPGDKNFREWERLSKMTGIGFSDSRAQNAFDFLGTVDAILGGESGILLEAALMNVYPIYYAFSDSPVDYYGYLRHGLVEECLRDPAELVETMKELIRGKPHVRSRAKFYCDTIGTRFDGKSTDLIRNLLAQIVFGRVDYSVWDDIPSLRNLAAYRLKVETNE